jgi:hypothetical protein
MGITSKDIAAQRAMLARGEEVSAVKDHHAERARLRDEFAAAALTGLLADDGDRTEYAMPNFTARAYEWADAMLLERNGAVEGSETVQCNTSVGVAEMDSASDRKSVATQGSAHSCGQPFDSAPTTPVCPHIRGTVTQHCSLNFTLTDEEREAIEDAVKELTPGPIAATLRNLLERTK